MTAPWWTRTWPDDEGQRTEDEPAEPELADEEPGRIERDQQRDR